MMAVPRISRARPELLAWVPVSLPSTWRAGCWPVGGWTPGAPQPQPTAAIEDTGHARHVATDPDMVRRGAGRALMTRVMEDGRGAGMQGLNCRSTRTAVPLYAALGFLPLHEAEVTLAPGIVFPVMRLLAGLRRRCPCCKRHTNEKGRSKDRPFQVL